MSEGDAVKVCLRVRPLIHREQGEQETYLWKADHNTISQVDGTRSFNFDRVFHSHETTSQVYQEVAVPIIRSALQGYNGTIFAYGQTSSGKTYTMMGTPDNLGIIPQAVQEVFTIIREIPSREFLLRVSYMEIYNETVTDLLCDDRKKKPLEIREDINRNVYVADLTEELVAVPEHVLQWIKKGEKNRHYGETKMNDHSSRSHTIFRMIVESRDRNDPGNAENCEGAVMVSHLNLVDLAGSERASQTGAEGVRFKEGCNINRSLFILGQVIKKLSDGHVGGFINYRDSKLTRILQNSLGGNTKTVIICTITPVSFDESLSTLQFASTAKHVRNTPHVNEVLDDQALLKRYRKEIMDLKKQLEELEASSEIKTQATAKEEHSNLLTEIKQLQKEREDRIWNLTNIVVASSQQTQEDLRVKRKRRVTWAPGKLRNSLSAAGVSPFEIGTKLTSSFAKRTKVSEISPILEIDDSICTEFSDFDDASRVLDDFAEWSFGSKVTCREKTALSHSMIDLAPESSALTKDTSLQKCIEMGQKVFALENQLNKLTEEYEGEVEKRESLEKETADLKQQLQSKNEKDEVVRTLELEIISLKEQVQALPEGSEHTAVPGDSLEVTEKLTPLKTSNEQEPQESNDSALRTEIDGVCQNPVREKRSSQIHNICWEQIQMLEQKVADLERNVNPENQNSHEELAIMQNNFDHLVEENESLKREVADLEKCLQEKHETIEFELLEKATEKEHEAQLIHEIASLKKLTKNAEVYNQELENELEKKTNLLKEQEKQISELKKKWEMLQNKVSYCELSASMGDWEKQCEEVNQMKQSLSDAETVTRDAQREAAFLRSENLELKDKMDELSIRCEKREKDASDYEKQLEFEKSNYKRMQADLQKELQYTFSEINHLNGLMAGKVPQDLLSRVELDKKVADYSKQLASLLEEKSSLENEVACLLEYKALPSEVEHLKDQVQRTSEELMLLKDEKEQSASTITDQTQKMLEQIEQIEKLTGEVTHIQTKCQQAEQQYSELKILHEGLQEGRLLTAEELNKKDRQAECLLKEMDELKHSVTCMEQKLLDALPEKDELLQAKQELETRVKELEELLKSARMENDHLQDKVNNMSSQVTALQQQTEKQSEFYKEKQDLEAKYSALVSEKEHLQVPTLNADAIGKLQELQDELELVAHHRDELLVKVEDHESERDHLKQDLNENIELSIETQDELRTTQEDLKQQKQLVSDLSQQLADCTGDPSLQAESQRNILEEEVSALTEKLQENKAKYEILTSEKMELERVHQSLISEMKLLQERMRSAERAPSKVEEENNELKQKLKSGELYEPMNRSNNLHESDIQEEDNRQVQQENDVKGLQLQEQILAMLQEKDALHETLKNIAAERDQLRVDLQENIEMSIDTQGELRSALDELKVKTPLLESLNAQMNNVRRENGEFNSLCEHQRQDCEKHLAQLEAEKSTRTELLCEVDVKSKKIKELETKLEDDLKNLQETESKYEKMAEKLDLVTKEKDHLISSLTITNASLVNELAFSKKDKQTKDQELQVCDDMPINLDQFGTAARLEETEIERNQLNETLSQLQHQLQLISQERGELQQLIDNLKAERCELLADLQRYTDSEALRSREECELLHEIGKLKEQLKTVQEQLKDQEGVEAVTTSEEVNGLHGGWEERPESADMEIKLLEENPTKNTALLEELQGEKLELLGKLGLLQQELQKAAVHRDELRCQLGSALKENTHLRENLDSVLSCSSRTQEELQRCQEELNQQSSLVNNLRVKASSNTAREEKETATDSVPSLEEEVLGLQERLLQKSTEHEQLLQNKEKLEQDMNLLSSRAEGLMKDMEETQSTLESLQNEKLEAERQLLDLQQQMEVIVQERDHLKNTQQTYISEINQENSERVSPFENEVEQGTTPCHHEDLVQSNLTLKNDLELLMTNLKNREEELETLRSEKYDREQKINHLQHQVESITEESKNLKVAQECLVSERDQRQEQLEKNIEKLFCLQEEVLQNATVRQELIQKNEELEQGHISLKCEIGDLMKTLMEAQSTLESLQNEKLETEKLLATLQEQMDLVTQERDELNTTKEKLTLEMASIEENLMNTEANHQILEQEALQVPLICNHVLDKNLKDNEAELTSLRNEKSNIEEKFFSLQQHMEMLTHETDELKIRLQSLLSERDQLKDDLRENVEMSIETQDDLRQAQNDLQQQRQKVDDLTSVIASLEQKCSSAESELQETLLRLKEAGSEREILEQSKQKLVLELEQLHNEIKDKEFALGESEKKIFSITVQLETMSEERNQMQLTKEELQKRSTETQDELQRTQEELQQQKERVDQLINGVSLLEEKSSSLERELQEKILLLNEAVEDGQIFDQSKQDLTSKMEHLMEDLKSKDFDLKQSEKEREAASQKILELADKMRSITHERDDLQHCKRNLEEEANKLREEIQQLKHEHNLLADEQIRKTSQLDELEFELQKLREKMHLSDASTKRLEKDEVALQKQVQQYELEVSSLHQEQEQFQQLLQRARSEKENLYASLQDREKAVAQLQDDLITSQTKLQAVEKECEERNEHLVEKVNEVNNLLQQVSSLQLQMQQLHQSTETQEELQRTQEELQQQKERVDQLINGVSLLEEKSSSLERELQEKILLLNEAVEDGQIFDQSKQDLTSKLEHLMEDLKSKDFDLKQSEKEREAASQKILELADKMRSITHERDDLQHCKRNLEEEANKLREEIQQLKHEHNLLADEQIRKTSQLDELEFELQKLREKMHLSDASTKRLETDEVALQKQVQQYELEVSSLHQEQEQFQQLLQRARSEKENLYASLQDREKAVAQLQDDLITSQTKLQAVEKECEERNEHLVEKVNEVNNLLQQVSSLQLQMQQLHQEVKDEKTKNRDLCDEVDNLGKEVKVLRLMQSEPAQDKDELAERTEILEGKTQEWKGLIVNVSTVYLNHYHSLLSNIYNLQSETEAQKQSMSAIKESLSSTLSTAFGNLQAEHIKLNTQMQTVLNNFKVVYRAAVVKDEQYNLVKDYESELCAVQRKNDELLLQCQSLEQHGTRWSESAAEELKFCELEFLSQLIFKKIETMKRVEDGFSAVQVALSSIEVDLQEEIKCKKEFLVWLEEFKGLHFDTKRLNDGVLQENRRIVGVIQDVTKKLKIICRSKIKQDTMMYVKNLETDLQEKKDKNKELLQRLQRISPSGDSNILEEENARLRETLKNIQELKKMQLRIQDLENQLSSAKADAKQKEQQALQLEDKLRSSIAESDFSELQVKMKEKENHFQAALKEMQTLQEKVTKGVAPYRDEIDSLKSQVARVEMDRMKLSKATDQQIASLKACIEDKEVCVRKLKEQLRRTQKDTDTTIRLENSSSSSYPLTCGGGSGIVQSTAMLVLQSENAAFKREIAQYKKKCHQLSRNISCREEEVKKLKDPTTPHSLLHPDEVTSHRNNDLCSATPVSPSKSETQTCHIASPGKTGIHRKHVLSPRKTEVHIPQSMSPNKMERHSAPAMSPGNTGLYRKRPVSPLHTDGPLFSALTVSPCKQLKLPKKVDSPKDKFFDVRSKSLPYCPSKFFDNSNLGTLPDTEVYAGTTAEASEVNNWIYRAGKTENPNDCKTS
ncbi:centromere-associated protein E isoform X2 [Rhinoderma darwinii]|uniref:centromere-associated protein E isoform X2 n=1 Tax=Rhinoderma darwinii TaxID=43563 RepID=UPI003F66A04C